MKKIVFSVVLVSVLMSACTDQQVHRPATVEGKAVSILKRGLQSRDAKMRTHAIEIAAETSQKNMVGLISKLTTDPIVPVRFAATVALGDMKCSKCEKTLRKSLNDPDVNVRIGAAYSLVKLNYPKYVEQIRAAAKSPDQTVRANAALLLGKLGNPNNLDLLYEVMEEPDSTDKVRMQAVESIARLGDERMYRSKLWALQISKFADDRVMGIRGMGALNTAESRNAITMMLQDEVLEVRLAAAEQLARLGDKRGEEEVLMYFALTAAEQRARFEDNRGEKETKKIGEKEIKERLGHWGTTTDLNQANMANGMAVMAIGHLKNSSLNALLPKALDSQSPYIQLLAAQSVLVQLL